MTVNYPRRRKYDRIVPATLSEPRHHTAARYILVHMDRPHSRYARCEEQKAQCPCQESNLQFPRAAGGLVTTLAEPSRGHHHHLHCKETLQIICKSGCSL